MLQSLAGLVSFGQGYRTYLSAFAALLAALSTVVGLVDPGSGMAAAAALLAVSQIFQRMAAKDQSLSLASLQADLQDLTNAVKPVVDPAEPPATIKMI